MHISENQQDIVGQFDGIYFERNSCRLFVMERGRESLQEVLFSSRGECVINEVEATLGKFMGSRGPKLRDGGFSKTLQALTGGLFAKTENYRTHKFAYDSRKNLVFVLQSLWKGKSGFDDKIDSQNIRIYNLSRGKFEGWGELKIETILQSSDSQNKLSKHVGHAIREAKNNKITGISTGHGHPWNLSLMYDNGLQIKLIVLESADNKSYNCLLHEFQGRRIETEAEHSQANFMAQKIHTAEVPKKLESPPTTTEYLGFESIQAFVHKQVTGRKVRICVENNLNMVPAAAKYNQESCRIFPAEKGLSNSLSTILTVQ